MCFRPILGPVVLCGMMALVGCGQKSDGRPKRVPVTGVVLLDGEPSAGARVLFVPQGHPNAASAKTDDQGRFALQTFDPKDGAVPGDYKVMVSNFEVIEHEGGGITENHYLPKKYRNPETSGLTAIVEDDGPNEFMLELTAPESEFEESIDVKE